MADLEMVQTRTLSEATREAIRALVNRYPRKRTALLPSLKLAQRDIGFLPREIVAEVAELVGVSHAAAQELTTFYSMLRMEPTGELHVEVCVQLPCAIAGGERLLRQLSDALGIKPGETTPDGRVTLIRTPECLGACHRAPMCRVNEDYAENLGSPEALRAFVALLTEPVEAAPRAGG
jgi:NADH-quinone oxidoreductase E subunit